MKAPRGQPCRADWDFRGIAPIEIEAAVLHESARLSERIRDSVGEWTARKVEGRSVREWLSLGMVGLSTRGQAKLLQSAPNFALASFLQDFPEFPDATWMDYRTEDRTGYLRVLPTPTPLRIVPASDEKTRDHIARLAEHSQGRDAASRWWLMRLDIDSFTKDELLEAFGRWLDEAKSGRGPKRGRGGIRPKFEDLRALAARRLSEHGMTYDAAQGFLADEFTEARLKKYPEAWPDFADPSGWSRALARSKELVAEAERVLA